MLHKHIAYLLTLLLLSFSLFTHAQDRREAQDIEFGISNSSSTGTWSDGTTLWVADRGDVSVTGDERIFAYTLSTGVRDETKEFDLPPDNDTPQGIWSNANINAPGDDDIMWVADSSNRAFAYNISNITDTDITTAGVTPVPTQNITLAFPTPEIPASPGVPGRPMIPGNAFPSGIWSDGDTMWVADFSADRIFAYDISDIENGNVTRDANIITTKEFDLAPANSNAGGIWGNVTTTGTTTLWVVNSFGTRIFAYNPSTGMPVPDENIVLDTSNDGAIDIWSNGDTMWVADNSADRIFVYDISNITDMDSTTMGVTPVTGSEFDLHIEPTNPIGIWSDRTTMWVVDIGIDNVFAYTLASRARDTTQEFDLHEDNGNPRGIWSDGETLWVVNSTGTGTKTVFAYILRAGDARGARGTRVMDSEITLSPANDSPLGIWSNANINEIGEPDIIWVTNSGTQTVFAYDLSTRMPVPDENIVLDSANSNSQGIWSNGNILWAADPGATFTPNDENIFAYDLSTPMPDGTLIPVPGREIDPQNDLPTDIWSDGTTLWVLDSRADSIFAYTLPIPIPPVLTPISFAGVPITDPDATLITQNGFGHYMFRSNEEGEIIYNACDTVPAFAPATASVGTNTVLFSGITDTIPENPCTITVTSTASRIFAKLELDFILDNTAPVVVVVVGTPTVLISSQVNLTATISDRAGAILNYAWNQTMGTDVALTTATDADTVALTTGTGTGTVELTTGTGTLTTTFTAPATAGDLAFTLTVTDDAGNMGEDTVTISVSDVGVDAGDAQTVASSVEVTLEATSTGLTSPTYSWRQVVAPGAPMVTFTTATDTATTTFTAPNSSAVLEFQVTATSGGTDFMDTVTVTVTDETAPMLMEVRAVMPTPTTDTTPEYTFHSTEAGDISYTGGCVSTTGTVAVGNNTITFSELAEGDYTGCEITVTDAFGNASAALEVSDFTIDTVPTVSAITTTTAAGSYGIGQMIAIQVVFTEPVEVTVVTGSPVLLLNNNGGQAVYSSGSGSSTLVFSYEVSAGQGTASLDVLNDDALSLAGASINDLSGNPAMLDLAGVATDALNNIRISTPSVIRVSGESGNYRAGDEVTIRVQFSEEIMVSPDAGLAPDEAPLQLALETGDVDRMAEFRTNPTIPNNTLEFIYRVEQGDRSQDLAYTSPNALVAVGDTLVTGAAPGLSDAELRAANLGALLSLPALDAPQSLAGSSEIVVGVLIEEQNARLNEILLPKIAQAMSAATVDAITRRIESGGGDSQASLSSGISDILPSGLASLKDLNLSWLKSFAYDFLMDKAEQSARSGSIDIGLDALGSGFDIKGMLGGFDIKRVLGNSEFVMPLNTLNASGDGTGSGATSNMVLWGSGNYSNLSDNDDGLDYDGDIYSINLGIDSQISQETLLGISVNWSNSDFDYRDAITAQSGDYGYRLYSINPYISWSPQGLGGSNLWATLGYGMGEIENQIEGVEKVETDTRQYQFSGGGRYILSSSADQLSQLSIKGDLTLLRVDIDQSAGFLGNDIDSQSFRLLLQGSSVFNYAGYSFTPSLEGGLRYDLGDGDTGGGIELSPAFTYKSLDDHILIEGRGRYLIAGQHDQWGLSVLARIDQARHGRGLSFSMHPTWGQSQAQAQQLTAHNGSRFNDYRTAKAEAQMKTELSYGMHMSHILGQTMLLTPYAEFTLGENARYYQFGQRLSIGELLNLSFKLSHHQRRGYADDNHLGLESAINF